MTTSETTLTSQAIRVALIGCGNIAQAHLREILPHFADTHIPVVCEPSMAAYEAMAATFTGHGRPVPPNEPDLDRLLTHYAGRLDAVLIASPHAYHHDQAMACLDAGLDVLLEKPMVVNAAEAQSLIDACQRTGKLLVVAFNGSLSPHIRTAVKLLRSGEFGPVLNISATIWQNWAAYTTGTWRQVPEIAGGGFLFDTGAHMLNTVADLAGEDFVEVSAWLDNRDYPVEMLGVVMARLASGALVTLNACGDTVPSCSSEVYVFCPKAILRTGVWGGRLDVQRYGSVTYEPVEVPPSLGVWQQFLAVRSGLIANPCPPEIGLRMARLWDAIRASAAQNGRPVSCAPVLRARGSL